ncbi:CTLH/CRA C-terminal to LisH motif domain-containing protein [Plasmodiophora brassicae]|uniref:CTLH/CRA C-terminal to LisH motif domain-containing protein n=1 Tax=Plasmodiophora brassicae TaxID=37360 RepID=A0A3P3Y604_PLABS|nr:unnamed protein product [Plasmodiophora brassicae]
MQPADVAALIDSHAHTATTAQDELAAAVQRLRDLADDVDGGQAGVGAIGDPIGQLRKSLAPVLKQRTNAVGAALQSLTDNDGKTGTVSERGGDALDRQLLDRIIIYHFLRGGRLDLAQSLINETRMTVPFDERFSILSDLTAAIRRHDLSSCIAWCRTHPHPETVRDLLFMLHRTQFMMYVEQGDARNAILYARQHLSTMYSSFAAETGALLATLLFMNDMGPNKPRLTADDWCRLEALFNSVFCRSMSLAKDSPLNVCIAASQIVMPVVAKMAAFQSKNALISLVSSSAQVAVDLGKEFQFHSTFVCPVAKTVDSRPALLTCGHVVSHVAIQKMQRVSRASPGTVKCPYCGCEQHLSKTMLLHF